MALIKSAKEIEALREGGKILGGVLRTLAKKVKPGVSTWELEEIARKEIKTAGAEPAFLGYSPEKTLPPYPAALCISIDDEVVHCVPDKKRVFKEGELVSLDLGVKYKGLFTDAAMTVPVGKVSKDAKRLITATEEALAAGIAQVRAGSTVGDIAAAVAAVGKRERVGVIRDLVGHGVGHAIHELPSVPNYGKTGTMDALKEGMVLAIEPMFCLGDWRIRFFPGEWTVRTADGSLAAHFEHTVAVTDEGCIILTEA